MKILIKNANLISMDPKKEKLQKDIDILIENNKIKKIEKNIQEEADKIIDSKNKIVMPGLINTHCHIPMSIFRETVDGLTTQNWLTKKIWPMEDKLTKEDIYYASILSYIEMIYTGCTTVNDMYFMQEEIVKAALDTGVRLEVSRTLMDSDGKGEQKLKELEDFINQYNNKYDLITLNVGIHGLYTNSEEYVEKGIEIAVKNNLKVNMHFCENSQEVEDIKKSYNVQSVVEPLEKYFKNVPLILAHSVKLTDEEIKRLSKLNVSISHCPVSNLKLGCGIAKISKMLEKNICVSLGTDGQGSGSNLDMFEEIKFCALLQKGILENPKVMPAYEVLKMATINGAKALGLGDKIGTIEEGKIADLIIINLEEKPYARPYNNIFAELIYNTKGENVETTIINGKILMENKKFLLSINPKEIYKKCEDIIKRIS